MTAETARQDPVQQHLADYATSTGPASLAAADVQVVKDRLLDTIAAVFVGTDFATTRAARAAAATGRAREGARLLVTGEVVPPWQAAFVNGTAARVAEINDVYVSGIGLGTHPSDVIMPVLAAAEAGRATGAELVAAVAVAYEAYMEMADRVDIAGYDAACLAGIGVTLGAAKVLRLEPEQVRHAVALGVVPNNPLVQTRRNQLSMWKAAAAGQAGSAGVWAAQLARSGMEGPSLPFFGDDGWGRHVARHGIAFTLSGGPDRPFRIRESKTKPRAACQNTISSILAGEDAAAQLGDVRLDDITRVVVSTYASAKNYTGTGAERWNPMSRETADHSIPYVVAAALRDGHVGPRQFEPDRLWDPALRALLPRIEVHADDEFTVAYEATPREHHTAVEVQTRQGGTVVGRTGGSHGDLADPTTWDDAAAKLHRAAEPVLGSAGVDRVLELVHGVDELEDVTALVDALVVKAG